MLNQLGVVKLFSDTVAATLAAASLGPFQCFLVLNTVYFVLHYLFASQTAQVGAGGL
jgi:DASS family divalent anion:Na+ symporter